MIDIKIDEIISAIKRTEAGEIKFDIDDDTDRANGIEIDEKYIPIVESFKKYIYIKEE